MGVTRCRTAPAPEPPSPRIVVHPCHLPNCLICRSCPSGRDEPPGAGFEAGFEAAVHPAQRTVRCTAPDVGARHSHALFYGATGTVDRRDAGIGPPPRPQVPSHEKRPPVTLIRRPVGSAPRGIASERVVPRGRLLLPQEGWHPMRLTLRTLLAWRDRTLPASHRDEMDGKVATNAAAHLLTNRIDRAIADDSLGPPRATAASDLNAVAEYLDNVLPLEGLDGFERACLGADDLLAEVASCHRILAEASLDPGLVPTLGPADRARLMQAMQTRGLRAHADQESGLTAPDGAARRQSSERPRPIRVEVAGRITPDGESLHATRRSSATAWLLAISAVLLLGVLTGVLAWSVGGGRAVARRGAIAPDVADATAMVAAPAAPVAPPPAVAAVPADAADAPQPDAPAPAPDPPAPPPPDSPPTAPLPAPPVAAAGRADAVVDAPAAVPARAEATAPAADAGAAAPMVQQRPPTVPFGDALAIAAAPAPSLPPKPAPPASAQPASAQPAPAFDAAVAAADAMTVVGGDALLVSPAGDDAVAPDAWEVAREEDKPSLPVRLLAPPFCRPEVELNGLRIAFSGGTRAEMRRTEDGRPWLVLDAGRCVVTGAIGPAELRLTAGGLDGIVTGAPGAPLGVEVERGTAVDPDPSADPGAPPGIVTRLHATQAAVPWRQIAPPPDADRAAAVPAASTLSWNTSDPAAVRVARRDRSPAWLASPTGDAFEKAARASLAASLKSGEPARPALERLGQEARAERRIAAAAALSLMGDHALLAHVLVEDSPQRRLSEEQWRRLERTAVPLVRADDPSAAAWHEAIDAAAPAGAGATLSAIVDAGIDGGAGRSAALVEALESPWLVVRRYAWYTLLDIEQPERFDRLRYRPDRPADLNADGVRWWRDHVARGDAAAGAR